MESKEAIVKIKEVARKNKERPKSQKTHDVNIKIGECYRQGDLYIHRVADNHPVGDELKRDKIADGVSLGSTHHLLGSFKVYKGVKAPDYIKSEAHLSAGIGYAFDAEEDCVNVHMEHDHFCFKNKGRYQVTHQLDLKTMQRVLD